MIDGKISEKKITSQETNVAPRPLLTAPGVILNGKKAENFTAIDSSKDYPDVRSFRKKFSLIIPATNTSMEHELWSIIFKNPELKGIGLHTSNVVTPKPQLETEADLMAYKKQFLGGIKSAVEVALLAQPDYFILGMSLEHILSGLAPLQEQMNEIETYTKLSWATWHDAIFAALNKFGASELDSLRLSTNLEMNLRRRCLKTLVSR